MLSRRTKAQKKDMSKNSTHLSCMTLIPFDVHSTFPSFCSQTWLLHFSSNKGFAKNPESKHNCVP